MTKTEAIILFIIFILDIVVGHELYFLCLCAFLAILKLYKLK